MKKNLLQFGKAMSAALFVLLLSVVGMKNALAQTQQVATLQHGDEISAYYGTEAFIEAHTAAVDGDIITLSSGSFNVPGTINKAITLRGAGVVTDSLSGIAPTVFTQQVYIHNYNDTIPFQMEGILVTHEMDCGRLTNPKFTRCSFNKITYMSTAYDMRNAQFVNCMIKDFYFGCAINTTLINSVVWNPTGINSNYSHTAVLYHSIMRLEYNNSPFSGLFAYNSIFIKDNNDATANYHPQNTCTFSNCIGIHPYLSSMSPFGNGHISGCSIYDSYEAVFESFTGTFSLEEPFILKEEIATGFVTSDGTQVAIYGGLMPYEAFPTYMVPVRCNVANRSDNEGKLNVEIEVINSGE